MFAPQPGRMKVLWHQLHTCHSSSPWHQTTVAQIRSFFHSQDEEMCDIFCKSETCSWPEKDNEHCSRKCLHWEVSPAYFCEINNLGFAARVLWETKEVEIALESIFNWHPAWLDAVGVFLPAFSGLPCHHASLTLLLLPLGWWSNLSCDGIRVGCRCSWVYLKKLANRSEMWIQKRLLGTGKESGKQQTIVQG